MPTFTPWLINQLLSTLAINRSRLCMAVLLPAMLALSTQPSQAQDGPSIKPGLWEVRKQDMKLNGQAVPDMSAQMAEQMKNMPPAARKQMQDMMRQRGIEMSAAPGGGMAVKMCISPDMVQQGRWQQAQPDARCKMHDMSHSGSTWSWQVSCTDPKGEGKGSTTLQGPDAFTSQVSMTTIRDGKPAQMDISSSARWLGSDCGSVKPIEPPQKGSKPGSSK